MLVNFNSWKERFEFFSKETGGKLRIVQNPSMGYGAEFITATINYPDNNIVLIQNVVSTGIEAGASFLILEASRELKSNNLSIQITDRDFMDKLFSYNRIICENEAFDKKFSIRSSDRQLALSVFKVTRVQELFLKNPLLVFNVSTIKGVTTIRMKDMERKLYSKEEMLYYLEEFRFLIGLIFYPIPMNM